MPFEGGPLGEPVQPMATKNWVFLEDLGPRTKWSSIRAKTLQALGKTAEDSICGGRMDRRRKAGYIEMLTEDLAKKVAEELDGYRDQDAQKESRSDLKPWRASVITGEEASGHPGAPPPRERRSSPSPAAAAERRPSPERRPSAERPARKSRERSR